MGWSHTNTWLLRIEKGISAAEVPAKKQGVPAQGSVLRKVVLTIAGCEHQRQFCPVLVRWRGAGSLGIL